MSIYILRWKSGVRGSRRIRSTRSRGGGRGGSGKRRSWLLMRDDLAAPQFVRREQLPLNLHECKYSEYLRHDVRRRLLRLDAQVPGAVVSRADLHTVLKKF